jgi:hypothetical protein
LFDYIGTLAPRRSLVWDCATGSGQAAVGLARRFDRVVATDASAEQVARAEPAPNVEYRVASAESSGLSGGSVGLVTVAQALHWFPHDGFFNEVRRVAAPGAVIAVWSYASCHAGDDVEALLREFEDGAMGPYWNPARKWVDEEYKTIPFPFHESPAPTFELHKVWTLEQLGGYLRSWSAVGSYVREHGQDPVTPFIERLGKVWGPAGRTRDIRWPLFMRVGRVG